ncbi:MAG: hypothetical protein GTO14_06340 [Anaerolineales bacterium]|nr:hypothetical protein [Anaerolineales bacterium]
MGRRPFPILLATFFVAGCAVVESPKAHDEAFVGRWIIDQPFHALYEASVYDFKPDGTIELIESVTLGVDSVDFVTGTVARPNHDCPLDGVCSGDPTCRFGDQWRSLSERRLAIQGNCTDGISREIVLDLTASTAWQETFDVDIIRVGDEAGWIHPGFNWSWRKCELEPCVLFRE